MCATNFGAHCPHLVRRGGLVGGSVVASDAAAAAGAGAVALCRLGRGALVLGVAEFGAARAPEHAASAAAPILFHQASPRLQPVVHWLHDGGAARVETCYASSLPRRALATFRLYQWHAVPRRRRYSHSDIALYMLYI